MAEFELKKAKAEIAHLRGLIQEALNRANEDDKITVPMSFMMLLRSGLETQSQGVDEVKK